MLVPISQNQSNIVQILEKSSLAPSTKHQYITAVQNYLATGNSLTDINALNDYALQLNSSSRGFLKAAIKKWTQHVSMQMKGMATPDNIGTIQASLYRFESLNNSIPSADQSNKKKHNWLSQVEVKKLLNSVEGEKLVHDRDRVLLAVLLGAGLRCSEAVNLKFGDISSVPVKNKRRTYLNILGKGAKYRDIPISDKLAKILDDWCIKSGNDYILCNVGMNGIITGQLSNSSVFARVRKYGTKIGKPGLTVHDLRRTYAQLGFEAGVPITQISKLLGHEDVRTTQIYLNLDTNYEVTISDFIPL